MSSPTFVFIILFTNSSKYHTFQNTHKISFIHSSLKNTFISYLSFYSIFHILYNFLYVIEIF
ncbi:hypothetical protein BDC45DRAFT_520004 [Circinella umbellata]|nr:hypothetical protein BDC45DRAFT_520004 [Circinella umbellata]